MMYVLCVLLGGVFAAMAATLLWIALLRITLRLNLPSFCGGSLPGPAAIPVVMYHAVERGWFAGEMQYLKNNNYQTISADMLVDFLEGRPVSLPPRPIVLTFDDGHRSLYTDAYPVLKDMGFHGVSFICPWWVRDESHIHDETAEPHTFNQCCTWNQFREMDSSGVIDVQAHTFAHQQIWVDGVVRGFVRPGDAARYIAWEDFNASPGGPNPPVGCPALTHASRFGRRARFLPDLAPMRACIDYVQRNGGKAFFDRPDWARQLRDVLAAQPGVLRDGDALIVPGVLENSAQREAALRDDLERTREMMREHLGKAPRHLCFPWNEADVSATVIAQQCGFVSGFRRMVCGRDVCTIHDEPMHIVRFKSDRAVQTVRCLPGRGRWGPVRVLRQALAAGVRRRLSGAPRKKSMY